MPDETSPLLPSEAERSGSYTVAGNDVASHHGDAEDTQSLKEDSKSYLTLVIPMAIGIYLTAMDGTIVVSSYAAIGSELKQLQNTSWIATAYMLSTTSFQPLYGKLSDIFGRKACLLFAYSIFALGCLFCGLSRNMSELIASRAFSGIGGGGMQTIVSIIVSDVVPLRSRGTWQGVLNIIWTMGSASGAPLGGFLADTVGWRWAFLGQIPLTVLAIASVTFFLHLPKLPPSYFRAKLRRIDFSGSLSLILFVFSFLSALDSGGNTSWTSMLTLIALASSVLFFCLFVYIELRWATEPFAPSRIIANQSLSAGYAVNFFGIAAAMCMIFHVSLWLQAVQGRTASQAGAWLVIGVAGGLAGSLVGGLTIQATGKFYWLTVMGYSLQLVGTGVVSLAVWNVGKAMVLMALGLVLSSLGNGSGITTSLIALIANAGQEDQAIATAVSYLFRSLGAVVGVSVGSTIVQETLRSYLEAHLSGGDIDKIILRVRESLGYIDELDPLTQSVVKSAYAKAVQNTLMFTVCLSACAVISAAFIKETALSRR